MKKTLLIIPLIFLFNNVFAQINFEKGYFIDNNNKKVNCYIKNVDWIYNPSEIIYKLTIDSKETIGKIVNIKEFGILNFSKFIRKEINIDRYETFTDNLGFDKNPKFKKETLFLKYLVEGKASLYSYISVNAKVFFYDVNNTKTEQLIYKPYKISNSELRYNIKYKMQLYNNLKCSKLKKYDFEYLNYDLTDLANVFSDYNNCTESKNINYTKKEKRDAFNISLKTRISNNSFKYNEYNSSSIISFDSKLGLGIGVEFEYILPFNKNKWALFLEPTYRSYKVSNTKDEPTLLGGILITDIKYNSIEIPLGIRHYIFLTNESKLFLNAALMLDYAYNSSFSSKRTNGTTLSPNFDIDKTSRNYAYGIGFNYKNKYSVGFRYFTSRDLTFINSKNLISEYNSISLIVGYNFL